MMVGMFVLRLVAGALFAGHGSQKLFGWFGGHGAKPTAGYFEGIGLTPALPLALLAGGAELAGGVLLTAGLLNWAGAGWAAAASVVGAAGSLLMLGLARIGHRTRRGGPQPHAA